MHQSRSRHIHAPPLTLRSGSMLSALLRHTNGQPVARCASSLRANSRVVRSAAAMAAAGGAALAASSAAVALCEAATAPPKFVLGGNQYDQTTFQGRLTHIQELIDMRTLFITDEEVAAAQALLAQYKKLGANPDGVSDEQLWDAQRKVNAVVHAPTGEKMNIFGRMSMFVPANVPIAAGLLMSKSTPAVLFWQWWNQTYNVFNNYVNRAGPTVEMVPLLQSYALAVTSACGIGAFLLPRLLATFPALQVHRGMQYMYAYASCRICMDAYTMHLCIYACIAFKYGLPHQCMQCMQCVQCVHMHAPSRRSRHSGRQCPIWR